MLKTWIGNIPFALVQFHGDTVLNVDGTAVGKFDGTAVGKTDGDKNGSSAPWHCRTEKAGGGTGYRMTKVSWDNKKQNNLKKKTYQAVHAIV